MNEVSNEKTNQAELESFEGENPAPAENTAEFEDDPLGVENEEMEKEINENYTVKYNGREVSLSLEELKTNAQKGLNYDHIKGELDGIKKSPMMNVLDSLARKNQMTREDFVMSLAESDSKKREKELLEMGMSESDAKKFASLENAEKERLYREESDRPYREFCEKFPNVSAHDIPNEVWQEFDKSGDLVKAYMDYENRRLLKQIKMLEQNNENKQRSLGAANSSGKANTDPFLEGLYS